MITDQSTGVAATARTAVRSLAKLAYYTAEESLHPVLRGIAERRVRANSPLSVLFVCHGNVCRSPYAAYAFQSLLSPSEQRAIRVQSAGFIGPDRSSPAGALAAAMRRGHDMNDHRSELISTSALQSADLVVVMSSHQARDFRSQFSGAGVTVILGDFDPVNGVRRTIEDPWNMSANVFDACYERIDRCVARLAELVKEGRAAN